MSFDLIFFLFYKDWFSFVNQNSRPKKDNTDTLTFQNWSNDVAPKVDKNGDFESGVKIIENFNAVIYGWSFKSHGVYAA